LYSLYSEKGGLVTLNSINDNQSSKFINYHCKISSYAASLKILTLENNKNDVTTTEREYPTALDKGDSLKNFERINQKHLFTLNPEVNEEDFLPDDLDEEKEINLVFQPSRRNLLTPRMELYDKNAERDVFKKTRIDNKNPTMIESPMSLINYKNKSETLFESEESTEREKKLFFSQSQNSNPNSLSGSMNVERLFKLPSKQGTTQFHTDWFSSAFSCFVSLCSLDYSISSSV